MHYLLFYEKIKDFAERQAPLQDAHRDYVVAAANSGEIVLAGNLHDPNDGAALILFECESADVVEKFAKGDPYVQHGIISKWHVRAWETVIGKFASAPLV